MKPPTILATSGGLKRARRRMFDPGPLLWHAIELTEASGRPKLAVVNTASGDNPVVNAELHSAFYGTDVDVTCVNLFPMPNFDDLRGHLLSRDVIWVGGGSVAGLLAMWRLHGLDEIMRECWEAGVVLTGVSAGSLCWHIGGTTDSFGPDLRAIDNGLGFLPYSNGVHYDSEAQRRPLLQRLVAEATLPDGYATDDGVGLVYRGTELVEAVSERPEAGAYALKRTPGGEVVETRIEPRLLPDSR
ncbi:MAG: Type 1 glutamine amidotransferase-like domain-containing protein [Micromonosporaceae bacterium]